MVKEMAAMKQKEKDDWHAKVKVASTHFKVNTKPSETHAQDKYKNLIEGAIMKKGFKLGNAAVKRMNDRSMSVKRGVSNPPVAMLSQEEFKMNAYSPQPLH